MTDNKLNETIISRAIIETYTRKLLSCLELDAAIAGAGPSGLVAGYELAKRGRKTAIFERRLSPGGGIWGGGIGYNIIVVQKDAVPILSEIGVKTKKFAGGYYTASAVETASALILAASTAGAEIFNLFSIEDVMISNGRICGVVVNGSPIEIAGLHVDPISIAARYVIEATGHPLEVLNKVVKKCGIRLSTPSGAIEGEKSMNAAMGERSVVESTVQIAPGLFVAGMAANAALGAHRMGPIFGGMLLSGRKAAMEIDKLLKNGG